MTTKHYKSFTKEDCMNKPTKHILDRIITKSVLESYDFSKSQGVAFESLVWHITSRLLANLENDDRIKITKIRGRS